MKAKHVDTVKLMESCVVMNHSRWKYLSADDYSKRKDVHKKMYKTNPKKWKSLPLLVRIDCTRDFHNFVRQNALVCKARSTYGKFCLANPEI